MMSIKTILNINNSNINHKIIAYLWLIRFGNFKNDLFNVKNIGIKQLIRNEFIINQSIIECILSYSHAFIVKNTINKYNIWKFNNRTNVIYSIKYYGNDNLISGEYNIISVFGTNSLLYIILNDDSMESIQFDNIINTIQFDNIINTIQKLIIKNGNYKNYKVILNGNVTHQFGEILN